METVDRIYMSIAQAIVDAIDADWAVAQLRLAFFGNSGEFDAVYKVSQESDEDNDFDVEYPVFQYFKKLHNLMTSEGGTNWNRAVFTLYRDGAFNIEFEWDQELADEIKQLGG